MFGLVIPKGIVRYSVMPDVVSRFRALFLSGFHYIPFFIAAIYRMVGLLPHNHPYLYAKNMGLFGVHHVIAEAAGNLKFSWKHIDQIVMFSAVLVGIVLFLTQILSLGAFVFLQPAIAAATATAMPTSWTGFFAVDEAYRPHDLAFMMLDMVFGVQHPTIEQMGFFESCIGSNVNCMNNAGATIPDIDLSSTNADPSIAAHLSPLSSGAYTYFPFPYHEGMHRLFGIYSAGLLIVAVAVTSYFVATILAETAQTGTAFGKRFNKTWAPIRVVMAFALLVPLSSGLNGSQFLVLYAAKYGSSFATNGWTLFNETLTTGYLGEDEKLVSMPNIPDFGYFTQFLYVARTCKAAYEHFATLEKKRELREDEKVHMYVLVKGPREANNIYTVSNDTDAFEVYDEAVGLLSENAESWVIRFGVKDNSTTADYAVNTECGEISQKLMTPEPAMADGGHSAENPGPNLIQGYLFTIITQLWRMNHDWFEAGSPPEMQAQNHRHIELVNRMTGKEDNKHATELDAQYVNDVNYLVHEWFKIYLEYTRDMHNDKMAAEDEGSVLNNMQRRGWGGAGIWYNRIAEMNGSFIAAVYAIPTISRYPDIMENVLEIKGAYNKNITEDKKFEPKVIGVSSISQMLNRAYGEEFASILYAAQTEWGTSGVTRVKAEGNPFLDAISSLFGLNGLYDMRKNTDTHPLAQLTGIGRSLVESAIQSLGLAALSSFLGAVGLGELGTVSASFFVSIAMLGLTVGFVMFYVVPFLPFIYFFFAVGGWIKGVFEATVGAPLWALAHIRIDGQGMPGQAAMNGYFLIFEIFLRPILIVFGLLAGITIFSALVSVLNDIFSLVTDNVGGYDMEQEMQASGVKESTSQQMRSKVDEFFFTVIYAVIVYLIGMSSFKLIDHVPNQILRWMGQSVESFGDQAENPTESLVSRATMGSQQALGKIGGGLHSAVGAVGKASKKPGG